MNARPLLYGAVVAAAAVLASAAHEARAVTTVPATAATSADADARRVPATLDPRLLEAAPLLRSGELAAAEKRLAPILANAGPDGNMAALVLGLAAYDSGQCSRVGDRLDRTAATPGLEDWRLYAQAECAALQPELPAARAALEQLLASVPDSPLRERAVLRLSELAWSAADAPGALRWIERGRTSGLPADDAARLEELAWKIGRATGDVAVETTAARRLLVGAPIVASQLEVAAALSARGVVWQQLLNPAELLDRTDALLRADIPLGALTTLDAVPEAERSYRYRLLRGRALTASQRGEEAAAELAQARPATRDEQAELDLARAAAAEERATVRRGRTNLPADARSRHHDIAIAALAHAAEIADDDALRLRALRKLYAERESEERIEEAIQILRRIVTLAPSDTLGARALWERGWRAYVAGNASGAVGYWRELTALYPKISYARSADYWTARALESLGDHERARAAFVEIAASRTRDFYARQAGLRLAGVALPEPGPDRPLVEPWPSDPRLARADLLSALGLDRLALVEAEELATVVDPRAAAALRGRALARQGEWRESLRALRKAFPQLGTAHQESVPREALALYYPRPFDERVRRFAESQNLPSSLVFGIVHQESGFDAAAVSRSGARGLMQLMPSTARELSRRLGIPYSTRGLLEPEVSLRLGTTYFRQMLGMFDDRVELALASYNGGPGRIGRLWRERGSSPEVDLFLEDLSVEESRNYVKRILLLAESYRSLYSDLS